VAPQIVEIVYQCLKDRPNILPLPAPIIIARTIMEAFPFQFTPPDENEPEEAKKKKSLMDSLCWATFRFKR